MDIITTSLEALIQRATCNKNQCPDTAAIDAFCGLICKEPGCAQTATRFITAKVHSLQEWEALQALHLLDTCMKRCGSYFHTEVGKFRFLNELIKLVSPKYNGAHTPGPVKRRVLELLQAWTIYYPQEPKIKEAYEMLKKQGVVKEEPLRQMTNPHKALNENIEPSPPWYHGDSIFQDTEKSRLLQKLLQSKKPDDLQAANRLIQTMVKEDERRVEMKSRHLTELEAAHNNARLLNEMLSSYNKDPSSPQDLELIKELHATCLRYQPNIHQLHVEVQNDERLYDKVLAVNDDLSEVLEKYSTVIVGGVPAGGNNLLDLSSPSEPAPSLSLLTDHLSTLDLEEPEARRGEAVLQPSLSQSITQPMSDLASLGDIFSSLSQPAPLPIDVLKKDVEQLPVARSGLEELDALSKSLLQQSLPQQPITPNLAKVPMNQLSLSHQASPVHLQASPAHTTPSHTPAPADSLDLLIDSGEDLMTELDPPSVHLNTKTDTNSDTLVAKPFGDIIVPLESIKPGSLSPLTVLEERGITVTIHFGEDSPRPDVSVFVVTTTSKCKYPISSYLFQAIVPKCCRLRLQPPSSTELPVHNPFLPPAAITQVMLISSPNKEAILLRVVVSYSVEDETVTEMKEVENFPLLNS